MKKTSYLRKHQEGVETTLTAMNLLYPGKQGYSFRREEQKQLVVYEIKKDEKIIGYFYPDVMAESEGNFCPCADISPRWRYTQLRVVEEFDKGMWVYCSAF